MEDSLSSFVASYPWLMYSAGALGSLVVIATVVIKLTPTKADDLYLEKPWVKAVLSFLEKFSLIKLK